MDNKNGWDELTPDQIMRLYDGYDILYEANEIGDSLCPKCEKIIKNGKHKIWNCYYTGCDNMYFCSVTCMILYIRPPKYFITLKKENSSDEEIEW